VSRLFRGSNAFLELANDLATIFRPNRAPGPKVNAVRNEPDGTVSLTHRDAARVIARRRRVNSTGRIHAGRVVGRTYVDS
jgi:hypothetical protein